MIKIKANDRELKRYKLNKTMMFVHFVFRIRYETILEQYIL